MATSIIKPVHAGIDFSFTIAVADWSSSSPYTYTWTNSAVTDGCRVEVDFSSASTNTDTMYLSYEKVSGGIQFTAPAKPTTAITVVVHVINAQTGNTLAVTDEMVSSDAISGAANVNEALTTLNSNINNMFVIDYGVGSLSTVNTSISLAQFSNCKFLFLLCRRYGLYSTKVVCSVAVSNNWATNLVFRDVYEKDSVVKLKLASDWSLTVLETTNGTLFYVDVIAVY